MVPWPGKLSLSENFDTTQNLPEHNKNAKTLGRVRTKRNFDLGERGGVKHSGRNTAEAFLERK
jgi:hypothetical protein